jgi:hypothetical protein
MGDPFGGRWVTKGVNLMRKFKEGVEKNLVGYGQNWS